MQAGNQFEAPRCRQKSLRKIRLHIRATHAFCRFRAESINATGQPLCLSLLEFIPFRKPINPSVLALLLHCLQSQRIAMPRPRSLKHARVALLACTPRWSAATIKHARPLQCDAGECEWSALRLVLCHFATNPFE
jgi:hypothetical protein